MQGEGMAKLNQESEAKSEDVAIQKDWEDAK